MFPSVALLFVLYVVNLKVAEAKETPPPARLTDRRHLIADVFNFAISSSSSASTGRCILCQAPTSHKVPDWQLWTRGTELDNVSLLFSAH